VLEALGQMTTGATASAELDLVKMAQTERIEPAE